MSFCLLCWIHLSCTRKYTHIQIFYCWQGFAGPWQEAQVTKITKQQVRSGSRVLYTTTLCHNKSAVSCSPGLLDSTGSTLVLQRISTGWVTTINLWNELMITNSCKQSLYIEMFAVSAGSTAVGRHDWGHSAAP